MTCFRVMRIRRGGFYSSSLNVCSPSIDASSPIVDEERLRAGRVTFVGTLKPETKTNCKCEDEQPYRNA